MKSLQLKKTISLLAFVLLVLLTFLAGLKTLFVSFDIDEGYAIAQSYRMALGDRLLLDMWEPHQFSAYLSALLIKPWIFLTGTTDYIVLYLRAAGTLIHIAIGLFLYLIIRKHYSKTVSLSVFLLHLNFLAKWIALPEFELMSYWFLLLSGLFLFCSLRDQKPYLAIPAGLCLFFQLLSYPTMALLFPFYLFGIIMAARSQSRKPWKEILFFTLSCLLPGIIFLIYLFGYMDFRTFLFNLTHTMADPSHTGRSFLIRMGDFTLEFLVDLAELSGIFLICLLIYCLFAGMIKKEKPSFPSATKFAFPLGFMSLVIIQFLGCLLWDQNQFFLQERYLFLAAGALMLYISRKKKQPDRNHLFLYFLFLPSVAALFASLLLTNMSVNVSYTRLFPCVLLFFLFFPADEDALPEQECSFSFPAALTALCCIASLLLCKLVLIRMTGCPGVTVKAPLAKIENGPLKGLYIHSEFASPWEEDCLLLRNHTGSEDRLFLFGCENLLYLCSKAQISAASVQGTSVFDQNFLDYLEEHPEKYPTVVAVDHRFPEVEVYRYSPYNYIVADWIRNDFPYEEVIESPYMTLYIRHD